MKEEEMQVFKAEIFSLCDGRMCYAYTPTELQERKWQWEESFLKHCF